MKRLTAQEANRISRKRINKEKESKLDKILELVEKAAKKEETSLRIRRIDLLPISCDLLSLGYKIWDSKEEEVVCVISWEDGIGD